MIDGLKAIRDVDGVVAIQTELCRRWMSVTRNYGSYVINCVKEHGTVSLPL